MGRTYDQIDDRLADWLVGQPVFFVATSPLAGDGHINCSPKGNRGELAVLDDRRIAYLDQTGSGIETVAHLAENGRIVLMFCAFEGPPRIVRIHGRGAAICRGDDGFDELADHFGRGHDIGVRSVIVVEAERISDSCGYGVPFMTFDSHRKTMDQWAERKGPEGITAYWGEKNVTSLDGLPGLSA
ncbi:MAG TPA: pyridoxamine 5'-phosphate oxidase family protein [Acidimicrobiales bacterium]|jgi:hypothetical protein|nr:pyridoxamine 5'-phosphate oxidase family protein [Acidimicrobiales bacterium]